MATIVAAGLGVASSAVARPAAPDRKLDRLAGELLAGLRGADVNRIPAASGYGRPTVRIRAFGENEVPIPAETANAWNRRLLRALQQRSHGQFEFVDEGALAILIKEMKASGLSSDLRKSRIADLQASARADIVITGAIIMAGTTPVLSYQAIGAENGRILASTAEVPMTYPPAIDAPSAPVLRAESRPASAAPRLPAEPFGYRRTVEETEIRLRDLGYDPGPVDGVLTWETRRALRAYQLDSALPVHGRMTRRSVENMRRDTR